jgi:hypothetical protein
MTAPNMICFTCISSRVGAVGREDVTIGGGRQREHLDCSAEQAKGLLNSKDQSGFLTHYAKMEKISS